MANLMSCWFPQVIRFSSPTYKYDNNYGGDDNNSIGGDSDDVYVINKWCWYKKVLTTTCKKFV